MTCTNYDLRCQEFAAFSCFRNCVYRKPTAIWEVNLVVHRDFAKRKLIDVVGGQEIIKAIPEL
jgi:hypothetical protein